MKYIKILIFVFIATALVADVDNIEEMVL